MKPENEDEEQFWWLYDKEFHDLHIARWIPVEHFGEEENDFNGGYWIILGQDPYTWPDDVHATHFQLVQRIEPPDVSDR